MDERLSDEDELDVDWHLTNRCNFFCEYCHPQIRNVLNRVNLDEPSAAACVDAFNRLRRRCHISMSGGEPFLFPGFVDLCAGLTLRHRISINTNLASDDVAKFAKAIAPNRVRRIAAAIHIAERERLGESVEVFVRNYLILREAGFPIVALYVLYPPLLGRAGADMQQLRNMGVDHISGKIFKGVHEHQRYPDAYDDAQRETIRQLTGEYPYNEPYLKGMMSFTRQECRAGQTSFKVMVTGEVRRCASVQSRLGNIYNGSVALNAEPMPCPTLRILVVSQCLANLVEPPAFPIQASLD